MQHGGGGNGCCKTGHIAACPKVEGREISWKNECFRGSVSRKKSRVSGLEIIYWYLVLLQIVTLKQNDDDDNDMQTTEEMPCTSMYTTLGHKKKRLDKRRPGAFSEGKGRKEKEQQTGLSCVV